MRNDHRQMGLLSPSVHPKRALSTRRWLTWVALVVSTTLLLQAVSPVLADGDDDGPDPDAPQSLDAHGISPTSIVVDFVGPDLEPDQYQIWRDGYLFDSPSTANWSTYSTASGEGQVLSLGLAPNTVYWYHVCAVYAGYDPKQFCADQQAQTLPPLPPPFPPSFFITSFAFLTFVGVRTLLPGVAGRSVRAHQQARSG